MKEAGKNEKIKQLAEMLGTTDNYATEASPLWNDEILYIELSEDEINEILNN